MVVEEVNLQCLKTNSILFDHALLLSHMQSYSLVQLYGWMRLGQGWLVAYKTKLWDISQFSLGCTLTFSILFKLNRHFLWVVIEEIDPIKRISWWEVQEVPTWSSISVCAAFISLSTSLLIFQRSIHFKCSVLYAVYTIHYTLYYQISIWLAFWGGKNAQSIHSK